jgi:hypothetical protein
MRASHAKMLREQKPVDRATLHLSAARFNRTRWRTIVTLRRREIEWCERQLTAREFTPAERREIEAGIAGLRGPLRRARGRAAVAAVQYRAVRALCGTAARRRGTGARQRGAGRPAARRITPARSSASSSDSPSDEPPPAAHAVGDQVARAVA